MSGPTYGSSDTLLQQAEKDHVKAIYAINARLQGIPITAKTLSESEEMDSHGLVESIRQQVSAVAHNKNIAWWYLTPEELRYWNKAEMKYLELASHAIREADPLKRPVWMYDPGHRNALGLSETVKYLDISGKGMYANYYGFSDARIFCRWTIEQELEGIKKSNPSAIPIAVPEMFQEPKPEDLKLIPVWVRHDVYASLIAGAKGVVVFSFAKRGNFKSHRVYYEEYSKAAEELCGPLNLGQVFLFGESRDDIVVKIIDGPEKLPFYFRSAGMKAPVEFSSIGMSNIAFGNERYVFLASSANVAVSVEIKGFPVGVLIEDVFNKRQIDAAGEPCVKIVFSPLEVKCLRFKLP